MLKTISIRGKVALLLSVLVLVIVYMSFSRIVYLREKEATFLALTESSRVAVEAVNGLRLSAIDLDALALRAVGANDVSELGEADDKLRNTMAGLRNSIIRAEREDEQAEEVVEELSRLESGLKDAIAKRSILLSARREFETAQARLKNTLDVLHAELTHLNFAFRVSDIGGFSSKEVLSVQAEQGVLLRVQLSALLDRGRLLATLTDPARTSIGISEFTPAIGESLRTLSAIGPFEERASILLLLSEVRSNIQSSNGLQEITDRVVVARADFDVAARTLRSNLSEINKILNSMVIGTEDSIARIFQDTRSASRRAIRSEILFSWGAGLGLIVAVWLVFLQQVSRRIEVLSADVLRIAGGDVDTPTTIGGSDEIGRMGEALKVFRKNARELRRSNEQLRNFAYAASHDLRSPLRAIHDLASWTIEDSEGQLPSDAERNILLIKDRAERLSRLLTDLLAYARADRKDIERVSIDLLRLTRDVAELSDPAKRFTVTYSGVRNIESYPTPLNTIVLNLVANAIRHHDQDSGSVSIFGKVLEGRFVLEIGDDGPGINEDYHDKIFEMFQTLRPQDEHEGSGMGLAMVRKLAHALDGEISIASNPSERRGTVFTLNIPIERDSDLSEVRDSTLNEGVAA